MKNFATRFDKATYLKVSELGTRLNLSFSSQLVFGNKIIALDGIKKCLLVLETDKESNQPYVIDLNSVAAASVKKSYGNIDQGQLQNKGIEEFLKRIDLQFEFSSKKETVVLSFYNCEIDDKIDRPKMVRNAKNWQMILSKLIGLQTGKMAKEL